MSSKLLALAASLLIAGSVTAQTGQPKIENAWARATPGKAENGAAYLTIVSPVPDRLTAASTPDAKTAELHEMTMQGLPNSFTIRARNAAHQTKKSIAGASQVAYSSDPCSCIFVKIA